MAQYIKESSEKTTFPDEPCDKGLLLNSIKKYSPDGVILAVERIITPKEKVYGDSRKANINLILKIIGTMDKCILYVLDDDGKKIEYEDEMTGEMKYKMEINEGTYKTVFFPFYANIGQGETGLDEDTALIVTPMTSSYSLFKEALINNGDLPEDMSNQSIGTTFKELNEALTDFVFRGKFEMIKTKSRRFPSLKVERVEDSEIE